MALLRAFMTALRTNDPARRRVHLFLGLGGVLLAVAGIPVSRPVTALAGFAAVVLLFRGTLMWRWVATRALDRGDWQNGICALLIFASALTLGRGLLGPGFLEQALVARRFEVYAIAASYVLLGIVGWVTANARLLRRPGAWALMAGLTLATIGQVANAVGGPASIFMVSAGIAVVAGAVLPLDYGTPRPVGAVQSAQGAVVLLSLGVVVVGIGAALPHRALAVAPAAIASIALAVRLIGVIRDLTGLARAKQEARTDGLTGVPNRRAMMRALTEFARENRPTALLMIDLDDFKSVNDLCGHAAGDELLRAVASQLRDRLGPAHLLARLGGDEFAVVLTGEAADRADEIARSLVALDVDDPTGQPNGARASIGVSHGEDGWTPGELLRRADTAMYQAKRDRSGTARYDETLNAAAQEQIRLTDELRRLLGAGDPGEQVAVHFQPQITVSDGTVSGAEALVRWEHPRLGLLPPDRFLHLVESAGLMMDLTAIVLDRALEQWRVWRAAGFRLRISVNLSTSCVSNPVLITLLEQALNAGIEPADLVLEITETNLMADRDRALLTLNQAAARGFGISIDDYGTGYSSLAHLADLPASEIKVDRSFTSRLYSDRRTAEIVESTVGLAQRLGMRLVVEGVEDELTMSSVRDLGCDESQGYLHSRPLAPEAFAAFLMDRAHLPA